MSDELQESGETWTRAEILEVLSAAKTDAPQANDEVALQERHYLQSFDVARQREGLKEQKRTNRLRLWFALGLAGFVVFYILAVLAITIACGWGVLYMADAPLCMLLGSTTLNVLGLFHTVVRSLFPHSPESGDAK